MHRALRVAADVLDLFCISGKETMKTFFLSTAFMLHNLSEV